MDLKKFLRDFGLFIAGVACIFALIITIRYIFRLDRFGGAKIDWFDFVKIKNTMYYGGLNMPAVDNSLIGKKIGEVKFTASGNVGNMHYKFRNGDAAYLSVGTEIYSIPSNANAVAVKVNGKYILYVDNFDDYFLYSRKNNP
jgi:hypothetical protein